MKLYLLIVAECWMNIIDDKIASIYANRAGLPISEIPPRLTRDLAKAVPGISFHVKAMTRANSPILALWLNINAL
jgi:hypothetical protein